MGRGYALLSRAVAKVEGNGKWRLLCSAACGPGLRPCSWLWARKGLWRSPRLDLQNCSLKNPGPNFAQAHTAAIIDLQANPLKDNLTSTFHGFTQLQTLVLPQDVICPGGINAWLSIISYVDIQICQGQKDLCNSTGNPEMCPENGSCASAGPGLLQCVCADGFQGYKCMRQGSFPLLMFFGILGSTTLSISALLWGTQRRKAKTS
ncbi:all-trans retinoic acid-induced differentiation factor isoform X2 [Perognathus longimembris pacificus]|uniref:all-trans retinoic acid-induced differentiation factor isoform X2 n=1 Tax=Perognathus longimembris pacificus TaxID=214514 RepID=UPI0020194AF7|nr:all-trans retinoic acid-induced differentiation factor isoform X2 [Perognathus longimembris pacificus]